MYFKTLSQDLIDAQTIITDQPRDGLKIRKRGIIHALSTLHIREPSKPLKPMLQDKIIDGFTSSRLGIIRS